MSSAAEKQFNKIQEKLSPHLRVACTKALDKKLARALSEYFVSIAIKLSSPTFEGPLELSETVHKWVDDYVDQMEEMFEIYNRINNLSGKMHKDDQS